MNNEELEKIIKRVERQKSKIRNQKNEIKKLKEVVNECEILIQHLKNQRECLEKENVELLVNKNVAQGIAIKLKEENDRLKKAFDKACELLEDYTGHCPCGEELIEDLDCNECDNNCKECWKKYFMKEVLGNE